MLPGQLQDTGILSTARIRLKPPCLMSPSEHYYHHMFIFLKNIDISGLQRIHVVFVLETLGTQKVWAHLYYLFKKIILLNIMKQLCVKYTDAAT